MVKRTSLAAAECPVARSLDVIGDLWSLLIVRDAMFGMRRFGEFQKSLGIARNILAARLRALVSNGILETVPTPDGGSHRDYRLTAKGRDLFPILVALRQWGDTHLFKPGERYNELVDRDDGKPVQRLELRAHDGRLLDQADTSLRRLSPVITSA
jgi:DNA-binding HxlR family transcriptional regulator